jgi:hypothetical protein
MKATEVFVPGDYPTVTYVKRADDKHQTRLKDALETPKTVISVSGPSKTGKTVLVQKTIGEDSLIPIYGAQIRTPEDIWDAILTWIDAPSQRETSTQNSDSITPDAGVSGKIAIPGIGEIGGKAGVSSTNASGTGARKVFNNKGLAAVAREIAGGEFTVFLDDFHYIPRDLQAEIGKQIKVGMEAGIRFCIASVPHRADDVVRSNHELRGRTVNVDTEYWGVDDLKKIANQGFSALKMVIDDGVIDRLASEACTSPQIMQALCLQLCFALGVREQLGWKHEFEVSNQIFNNVLEETTARTDFTSLLKQMHAGPRTRGTERKTFKFEDGTEGDAYRAALLALATDPPLMELNYQEISRRIEAICIDDRPSGSSVTESYKQIDLFAKNMHKDQRIVEWDADAAQGTFCILDPYFLFFVRSSDKLSALGRAGG